MNYNYSIDDNNEHTGDGHRSIQRPPPKRQGTGLRPLRRRVLGTFYSYFFIVLKFIYMYMNAPDPSTLYYTIHFIINGLSRSVFLKNHP